MAKHSSEPQEPSGWHSRGFLPHFDAGEWRWQFITLHLGDALPQGVIERWRQELAHSLAKDSDFGLELRRKIEHYLDKGYGECYLRNERVAEMMQNSLLHFDEKRYELKAWVIMPNHTHFLLKPHEGFSLSSIVHSIKSFTALEANKIIGKRGQFWQEDYFDRYIRDNEHFGKTVWYIENNPVKAGLCEKPSDWRFGSGARTPCPPLPR